MFAVRWLKGAGTALRRAASRRQPGLPEPSTSGRFTRADRWISLLLFAVVVVTQFNDELPGPGDSRWYIPVTLSLIGQGDIALDEYAGIITGRDYGVRRHDGHLYNVYPLGPSLVALPIVLPIELLAKHVLSFDLYGWAQKHNPWRLESLVAVLVVACAVVVLYAILRLTLSRFAAIALALVFTYGTSTWPTASQALWQHGPSMLMLSLALYALLRARERPRLAYAASVPLFFSYVIRPTNAVPIALFSLYVLLRHRRQFPLFLAIGLVTVTPVFLAAHVTTGRLLDYYYWDVGARSLSDMEPLGLLGTLVSPARGLLTNCPVMLLAPVGVALKLRRRTFGLLDVVLVGCVVGQWLSTSLLAPVWWGGHSAGARFFTDVNPFLVLMMAPLLADLGVSRPWRVATWAILAILAALSVWIQWRNTRPETVAWSAAPANVDKHPARLWDWHDVPYLRGIQVVRYAPTPLSRISLWFAPNKSDERYGGMMALAGYEAPSGDIAPGYGAKVTVGLYWRALQAPDADYSVYVHLVDAEGNKVAQDDHAPGGSADYPPTRWRRGDVIYDQHIIDVPRDLPEGAYYVEVGVYNWETGQRLTVPSEEGEPVDHVRLAVTIPVGEPLDHPTFLPVVAGY